MGEKVRVRLKALSLPSRHKIRQERIVGDDLCHDDGKWKKLERTIDRDNDHYREVITGPETGKTILLCDEPLSEHQGQGSLAVVMPAA